MLDFVNPFVETTKSGRFIKPQFLIKQTKDLMIRGGDFYAIWDEEQGTWHRSEFEAIRLIDTEITRYGETEAKDAKPLYLMDAKSGLIDSWHKYVKQQMPDIYKDLDANLRWLNTPVKRTDYSSRCLPYPLEPCPTPSYDRLMSVLYEPEERHKLEWAIGAIVTGASKELQKFVVLYGSAGTGKSTFLNIVQKLFGDYCAAFDAKRIGSSNDSFALEAFKDNPLVGIQHDGDLSRIEDNTRLNSLVSHEKMMVNEKFKSQYSTMFNTFLFMGSNKPVLITDAKSGVLRRLIDVHPSNNKLPFDEYNQLTAHIDFELGGIACKCRDVFLANPQAYDNYIPTLMMGATNDFYNFMEEMYPIYKASNETTLRSAWEAYKTYVEDAKVPFPLTMMKFKEELKTYFKQYDDRITVDGESMRSYYKGFRTEKFIIHSGDKEKEEAKIVAWLDMKPQKSLLDEELSSCPAQYATDEGIPIRKWDNTTTTLKDILTTKVHYVKPTTQMVVADFDLKGDDGQKSFEKNLEAASKWPATYAEVSKSGAGIHLHYYYDGDVSKLSRVFDDAIEIKVFTGNASLRRKLSICNNHPIATINSGLPLKEDVSMVDLKRVTSEKALRTMIKRNLNKEYHSHTTPSVSFIKKILDEAYESDLQYDVEDLANAVYAFASQSTHQPNACMKMVNEMHFHSEKPSEAPQDEEAPIVFFDCEVFINLFVVCWKLQGDNPVNKMINPSPQDIINLTKYRLIGFNNRRYDNHILYGRIMGYSNEALFTLSKQIIGKNGGMFREAYNLSYTDVYDFSKDKKSLKRWEIDLGIKHHEYAGAWDKPVPEEDWPKVAEYCADDVLATEAVFLHCHNDWTSRLLLAKIAGLSPNTTTNTLTTRIVFGNEKNPNTVYTDLATGDSWDRHETKQKKRKDIITAFPGYTFENGHNMYRGEDVSKGGYVYSVPGVYEWVALIDVASMHPSSAVAMNAFGEYTARYAELLEARKAIKHEEYDKLKTLMGGVFAELVDDPEFDPKAVSNALKLAINSVYGLTSASFENEFRDPRNKNNIIALRGALFMVTLRDEVLERGYQVLHIKTDSIKIANADNDIISFCLEFAKKYGYEFEHEASYEKICLVDKANYIAKYATNEWCMEKYGYVPGDNFKATKDGKKWTATGDKFSQPYVFKTLFSHEPIVFEDMCEINSVVGSEMYLDLNETLPDVTLLEKYASKLEKEGDPEGFLPGVLDLINEGHEYVFVGRVGQFCPVLPNCGGGLLRRSKVNSYGRTIYDAVNSSNGYRWMEAETVKGTPAEANIDKSYYTTLVDDRLLDISQYADPEWFVA